MKRTDSCSRCGHSWEYHEPSEDESCVWQGAFGDWCDCPKFLPESPVKCRRERAA